MDSKSFAKISRLHVEKLNWSVMEIGYFKFSVV